LLKRQNFLQHCLLCLSVLHDNFDSSTKLFSDLHLAKFLNSSAKSFFLVLSVIYRLSNNRLKIVVFLIIFSLQFF